MRQLLTNIVTLILIIVVSSCVKDHLETSLINKQEALLIFNLPQTSLIETKSTPNKKNDLENRIIELDVLLFEKKAENESTPADDANLISHRRSTHTGNNSVSVSLPVSNNACWIVAVVNSTKTISNITKFADIKNLTQDLTALYKTNGIGTNYADKLPMYGQLFREKIAATESYTLNLQHICARIDVDVSAISSHFNIKSVTLLNGANMGHYVAKSPLIEYKQSDITKYNTTKTIVNETNNIQPIYLFENNGSNCSNYTDIVVGGEYTISGSGVNANKVNSYLKINLKYNIGQTENPVLSADILRNTLYKVKIQSINENKDNIGYSTIEDAINGEYTDAEIKIEIGTEALSDVVVGNGDYYMSFSNSQYIAYAPTGKIEGLTAFTLRFAKNSNSNVDMSKLKKEITLGKGSSGITIEYGTNNNPWNAGNDIPIKVSLENNAKGTIIVRIGNLVKEIPISRQINAENLPTYFNANEYIYAKFERDAPVWLKIAQTGGTPTQQNELHSENGFKLEFTTDLDNLSETELYFTRTGNEGRAKVYVKQYNSSGNKFTTRGLIDKSDISALGGNITNDFSITENSGKILFLGKQESNIDLYWWAEFSTDKINWSTNKPDWIDMPTSGVGKLDKSTIIADAQPITWSSGSDASNAQIALASATPKGTTRDPYDLSTSDGTTGDGTNQSTANCYMVGAPGTYKLPLVYGNALDKRKGGINSDAYTGVRNNSYALYKFIDHEGEDIDSPYIYLTNSRQNIPHDATLVWRDAGSLITDIKLSKDKTYLVFTIPKKNIAEGNAIVAVRNSSGTIMWSWHIWTTPYTRSQDKEVAYDSENKSYMMSVNLGWCSSGTMKNGSANRTVYVRLKQTGGNSTSPISYTQGWTEGYSTNGNNPFYQWGRKDPMLAARNSPPEVSDGDKIHYPEQTFIKDNQAEKIQQGIQEPYKFFKRNFLYISTWYQNDKKYNLWNAEISDNRDTTSQHIKTIYDPSPAGYVVPSISYFSVFENRVAGISKAGCHFYCGLGGKGKTIFFPSTGRRLGFNGNTNTIIDIFNGCYWSASPNSLDKGYLLTFTQNQVIPKTERNMAAGCSVRSVREK